MDTDHLVGYFVRTNDDGEDGIRIPLLGSPWFIGRNTNSEIRLRDPNVGERHCMLKISQQKTVTVHRLDPKYPVFVNGEEVLSDTHALRNGDVIRISSFNFKWNEFENREQLSQSLCFENLPEFVTARNQSAPEYLWNEYENEVKRDACETGNMCQENLEKCSGTASVANLRENIGSIVDPDKEIFSNAFDCEKTPVESDDNQIPNNDTEEYKDLSDKNCENISSVVPKTNVTMNKTSDLTEAIVEDIPDFELRISDDDLPTNADSSLRTPKRLEVSELSGYDKTLSSSKLRKGSTPRAEYIPSGETMALENDTDIESASDDIKLQIPENVNTTPPRDGETFRDVRNSSFRSHKGSGRHSTPVGRSCDRSRAQNTPEISATPSKRVPENLLDVVESPGKSRGRRSTGIEPCVGTPSDVYRIKRSILVTPGPRSSRDTAPKESQSSPANRQPRRRSSERKSTPLKARISDRCIQRESILHSPIIEDEASEKCEESQNESLNTDPKFRYVQSRRRRQFRVSSFAVEDRILEESETSQNTTVGTVDNVIEEEVDDEEDKSLISLNLCDDSSAPMTARIIINRDPAESDVEDDLNGTFTIDSCEAQKENSPVKETQLLKSILTPLSKVPAEYREKSAKKVTFACNVIAESYDENSVDCTPVADSYNSSMQQSSSMELSSNLYSKIEDDLDSFCQHEELLASERSRSSVFSHSSTSTPMKSSNNSSLSGRSLKSVSRSLDNWDKSFEPSQTQRHSRNDESSAISMAGDNIDLTELQDAEKEQSGGFSMNKTSDKSTNSTKEMSDEFVTPTNSKLVDSLNNTRESQTSRSRIYPQSYTSTPARFGDTISDNSNKFGSQTLEGVADLLKTPRTALKESELDRTANASHLRKLTYGTGVTPLLNQMKLNETVDSAGTPCVPSNRSIDSAKYTSCCSTANDSSVKRSFTTAGTPYPNFNRTANNTVSRLEKSFSFSCPNTTVNDGENMSRLKSSSLNRTATNEEGTSSSTRFSNLNATTNGSTEFRELVESPSKTSTAESTLPSALSESRSENVSLEGENSAGIKIVVTESTTLESDEFKLDSDAATQVFEEAETQAIEECATQAMEEIATQAIEEAATQDISEMEILEEAETQYVVGVEEAETQLIVEQCVQPKIPDSNVVEEDAIVEAIEDVHTQLVTEEEEGTRTTPEFGSRETVNIEDDSAGAESQDVCALLSPHGEEVETQDVSVLLSQDESESHDVTLLSQTSEEVETQEVGTLRSRHLKLGVRTPLSPEVKEAGLQDVCTPVPQYQGRVAEMRDIIKHLSPDTREAETQGFGAFLLREMEKAEARIVNALILRDMEGAELFSQNIEQYEKLDVTEETSFVERSASQEVELAIEVCTQDVVEEMMKQISSESVDAHDAVDDVRSPSISGHVETPDLLEEATQQGIVEETETREPIEEGTNEDSLEAAEGQNVTESDNPNVIGEAETQDLLEEKAEEAETQIVIGDDVSLPIPTSEATSEPRKSENVPRVSRVDVNEITFPEIPELDRTGIMTEAVDAAERTATTEEAVSGVPESGVPSEMETPAAGSASGNVTEAACAEENEETVESTRATKREVTKKNESLSLSRSGKPKLTPRSSLLQIPSPRTESPQVRRSTRISLAKGSRAGPIGSCKTPARLNVGLEKSASKRTRKDRDNQENENCLDVNDALTPAQRCRRTPYKKDEENTTLKRSGRQVPKLKNTMVDAETQTTARRSSLYPSAAPSSGSKRRALKKLDDNSERSLSPYTIVLPVRRSNATRSPSPFSVEIPVVLVDSDTEPDTSPRRAVAEGVSIKKKRASKKRMNADAAEEGAVARTSPKFASLPAPGKRTRKQNVLPTSSAAEEPVTTAQTDGRATKRAKNAVSSPQKAGETSMSGRTTKRGAQKTASVVSSPASTSSLIGSPKRVTCKRRNLDAEIARGAQKTESVVSSPASTSSLIGSPKRVTRKRRNLDAEIASGVAPPKRALRNRAANIAPAEEKPAVTLQAKPKRGGVRGSRERLNEGVAEPAGRVASRTKTAAEPTADRIDDASEPVEVKRATRLKKNASTVEEVAPTGRGRATRAGRQQAASEVVVEKAPSKNRKGATSAARVSVDQTEPESNQRAARNKRAVAPEPQVEPELSSTSRRGRARVGRETQPESAPHKRSATPVAESKTKRPTRAKAKKPSEEEESKPEPETKSTRTRGQRKNATTENMIVDSEDDETVLVKKSTRTGTAGATETKRTSTTKSTKKNESARSARGPRVIVTRKSLKLKTVTRRSRTKSESLTDDEPRKKRAKMQEPNEQAESAKAKSRRSVKVIVNKKVTSSTSAAKKSGKSNSKKVPAKDKGVQSPSVTTKTSMVIRSTRSRTSISVSAAKTTRRKK